MFAMCVVSVAFAWYHVSDDICLLAGVDSSSDVTCMDELFVFSSAALPVNQSLHQEWRNTTRLRASLMSHSFIHLTICYSSSSSSSSSSSLSSSLSLLTDHNQFKMLSAHLGLFTLVFDWLSQIMWALNHFLDSKVRPNKHQNKQEASLSITREGPDPKLKPDILISRCAHLSASSLFGLHPPSLELASQNDTWLHIQIKH